MLNQFVGSKLGIFGGFEVRVDEPGFEVRCFLDLGLGLTRYWLNRFKVWAFWRGSKFDLSSSKQFEVHYSWV